MAEFQININATKIQEYVVSRSHLYKFTDCDIIDQSILVGLLKSTNLFSLYYLLESYTDLDPWKTLKFKNIVYSNPTGFYLIDNAVKIPEAGATVYDFDVLGQLEDLVISNFAIKIDSLTLVQNETITFDLAVEDDTNATGFYTSVRITLSKLTCPPTGPVTNLLVTNEIDDNCSTGANVNVIVPLEGSRYVTITTNSVYGSPTVAGVTITTDTLYNLLIDADTGNGAIYSTVILRVYESSSSSTSIDSHILIRNHSSNIC